MELQTSPGDLEIIEKLMAHASSHATRFLKRRWLSAKTLEIVLSRPAGFEFEPGQRIRLDMGRYSRDYSIVSAPNNFS